MSEIQKISQEVSRQCGPDTTGYTSTEAFVTGSLQQIEKKAGILGSIPGLSKVEGAWKLISAEFQKGGKEACGKIFTALEKARSSGKFEIPVQQAASVDIAQNAQKTPDSYGTAIGPDGFKLTGSKKFFDPNGRQEAMNNL